MGSAKQLVIEQRESQHTGQPRKKRLMMIKYPKESRHLDPDGWIKTPGTIRRLLEAGHYPHNGLLGYGQDQGYQDLLHPPPHHPDRQPMDWRRIEPGYHGVHPPRGGGGNLVPIEDMDYGIGDYYRPHFGDHYGYHDPHRPRFEPRDEYWKPGRHLRQSNSEGRVPDHHDIGHFGMDRGRGRDRSGDDVRYGNGLEGTSGAGSRYLDDDTSESDNESFERRNWV